MEIVIKYFLISRKSSPATSELFYNVVKDQCDQFINVALIVKEYIYKVKQQIILHN